MLKIDGSIGEGGGQILRSSLSLSMITGKAFTIENIRALRNKPGLLRQHLTAVKAAARICSAEVEGDVLHSPKLVFNPGPVTAGTYHFSVGTAGSAGLVLQTILLPLLEADGKTDLTIDGGTHNSMAPPYHFIEKSYLKVLHDMGAMVNSHLETYGFYPVGGGRFHISLEGPVKLKPLGFFEPVKDHRIKAHAYSANIPGHIIGKEIAILQKAFNIPAGDCFYREVRSHGPGNVVMLEVETGPITTLFTGFGSKGVALKNVCRTAEKKAREYIESGVPVCRYLADQLLIPMALAGGKGFLTREPTMHTKTNIEVIKKFMETDIKIERINTKNYQLIISNSSFTKAEV